MWERSQNALRSMVSSARGDCPGHRPESALSHQRKGSRNRRGSAFAWYEPQHGQEQDEEAGHLFRPKGVTREAGFLPAQTFPRATLRLRPTTVAGYPAQSSLHLGRNRSLGRCSPKGMCSEAPYGDEGTQYLLHAAGVASAKRRRKGCLTQSRFLDIGVCRWMSRHVGRRSHSNTEWRPTARLQ